jgi:hypothetical protein
MPPKLLADENFNAKIIAGLLRREPSVDFQAAKAAGILGLTDQEVLATAAREGRILVSHDRETMPGHFGPCGLGSRRVAQSDRILADLKVFGPSGEHRRLRKC